MLRNPKQLKSNITTTLARHVPEHKVSNKIALQNQVGIAKAEWEARIAVRGGRPRNAKADHRIADQELQHGAAREGGEDDLQPRTLMTTFKVQTFECKEGRGSRDEVEQG